MSTARRVSRAAVALGTVVATLVGTVAMVEATEPEPPDPTSVEVGVPSEEVTDSTIIDTTAPPVGPETTEAVDVSEPTSTSDPVETTDDVVVPETSEAIEPTVPATTDAPTATAEEPDPETTPAPSTVAETPEPSSPSVVPTAASATSLRASQSYVKYYSQDGDYYNRTVTLTWSGVADDFDIYRRQGTSGTWQLVDSYVGEHTFTDTYSRNTPTGWYQYRVIPYEGALAGTPAYVSIDVLPVRYAPARPRNVAVTVARTSATVAWSAPYVDSNCTSAFRFCDAATSYIVSYTRVGGTWARRTTTSTRISLTGLAVGASYYVNVTAVNSAGRSTATATATWAYKTPNVVAQPRVYAGNRSTTVCWSRPTDNGALITRYMIQFHRQGVATWSAAANNVSPSTGCTTFSGLTPGVAYYYRVTAVSAAGHGGWSFPNYATPYTYPGAVRNLTVAYIDYSSVTLRWSPPSYGGGDTNIGYRVENYTGGRWVLRTSRQQSTTYTNGLADGYGCYVWRVAAVNSAGYGPWTVIRRCNY